MLAWRGHGVSSFTLAKGQIPPPTEVAISKEGAVSGGRLLVQGGLVPEHVTGGRLPPPPPPSLPGDRGGVHLAGWDLGDYKEEGGRSQWWLSAGLSCVWLCVSLPHPSHWLIPWQLKWCPPSAWLGTQATPHKASEGQGKVTGGERCWAVG